MRRLAALSVVAIVASLSSPARADGLYFTESFGGTDVKDELSAHIGSAMRIRAALGYRQQNLAFELWAAAGLNTEYHHYRGAYPEPDLGPGYKISTPTPPSYGPSDSTQFAAYGFDVKLLRPVARHLEVYLRGGLSKGFAEGIDASGRGIGIGAGAQLKGKVPAIGFLFWPLFFTGAGPKVMAAVYVETGYEFYRLHGPTRSTDAQLNSLMAGFAVGADF